MFLFLRLRDVINHSLSGLLILKGLGLQIQGLLLFVASFLNRCLKASTIFSGDWLNLLEV